MRQKLAIGLIGLAAVALVVAVVVALITGPLMGFGGGAFSTASTNLVLLGIAISLFCKASTPDH